MEETCGYSFLLEDIDNKFKDQTESSAPGAKRVRYSEEFSFDDDGLGRTGISVSSSRAIESGQKLRLSAEVDELKLANENLAEKYSILKDEFELFSDKHYREIHFLQDSNQKLKRDVEAKSTKYYDERKKWMEIKRNLELELVHAKKQQPRDPVVIPTESIDKDVARRREVELHSVISAKLEEIKHLSFKNSELEEKKVQLEQDIMLLRNGCHDSESKDTQELKLLRSRCGM